MDLEHLNQIKNNEVVRKRLAKFMTEFCFRNSKLENFHDRLTQEEMREIMVSTVNNSYLFLSILFTTENSNKIIEILLQEDPVAKWDDPAEIPDELLEVSHKLYKLLMIKSQKG